VKINVKCPPCLICTEVGRVEVEESDFYKWKKDTLIQDAFPYLDDNQREMLMTGTHSQCWDEMMEGLEDL
jgi:hypothetical protein